MHHLVGKSEIMTLLRVSRQRVDQLVKRPDFPAPVVNLAAGRVWDRAEVESWAAATGRPRDDPANEDPA